MKQSLLVPSYFYFILFAKLPKLPKTLLFSNIFILFLFIPFDLPLNIQNFHLKLHQSFFWSMFFFHCPQQQLKYYTIENKTDLKKCQLHIYIMCKLHNIYSQQKTNKLFNFSAFTLTLFKTFVHHNS